MPRIDALLAARTTVSFEFFPPKDDAGTQSLLATIEDLKEVEPDFVSVTYGAGGTTRERTHDIVMHIRETASFTPMAHLSCVAHTRDEIRQIAEQYQREGIVNILALAGDPPPELADRQREFRYASELVEFLRTLGDFCIGVAAHPEVHPSAVDAATDRKHLAAKLDLADFAITQFFFNAEVYGRMLDDLAALGCTKPIIPGVMPVTNSAQVERFAKLSGANFPAELAERLERAPDAPAFRAIGVEVATTLCRRLLELGAPGLHFYTLNRSRATRDVWRNISGLLGRR